MAARLPDFAIIGAMKCGTSSLHEQLAQRSGLFMSTPKEPNFFSDDEVYARGLDWYSGLFEGAPPGRLCGESSTHYTKLPTHSRTIERMRAVLPDIRLIYVMRHPVDRLVSHYIHEWTQNVLSGSLEQEVRSHAPLLDYGRYAMQLEPWLETYGRERVLPVFSERLLAEPDAELARVCRFLGDPSPEAPHWNRAVAPQNVSRERLRKSAWRDRLLALAPLRATKDRLPEALRERLKSRWRMERRPELGDALRRSVEESFDRDLARLGDWLGCSLSCATWHEQSTQPHEWRA